MCIVRSYTETTFAFIPRFARHSPTAVRGGLSMCSESIIPRPASTPSSTTERPMRFKAGSAGESIISWRVLLWPRRRQAPPSTSNHGLGISLQTTPFYRPRSIYKRGGRDPSQKYFSVSDRSFGQIPFSLSNRRRIKFTSGCGRYKDTRSLESPRPK